jgi:CRP-like cAMP-binding protein
MKDYLPVFREPVMARLAAFADLNPFEAALLDEAARMKKTFPPGREIMAEGEAIEEAHILLGGWAYRARILPDGRRQIIGFLLPGDLIGLCRQRAPVAATSVIALTSLSLCTAPSAEPSAELQEAYAVSGALDEHYHFRHIARLGRMNAYERIADWLLEIRARLELAGLARGDSFGLPATQELLADALGLTSVHINRTLQAMRREKVIQWGRQQVTLLDRARLEDTVGYNPPVVSAVRSPTGKAGNWWQMDVGS